MNQENSNCPVQNNDKEESLQAVLQNLAFQILGRRGLAPYEGEPDELDLNYCVTMSKLVNKLKIPEIFDEYLPCVSGNTKIKSSEISILYFVQSLCYSSYSQMDMYSFWQCHSCREVLNKDANWVLHSQVRKSYASFLAKLGCIGLEHFLIDFLLRFFTCLQNEGLLEQEKINIKNLALLAQGGRYGRSVRLGGHFAQSHETSLPIFDFSTLLNDINLDDPNTNPNKEGFEITAKKEHILSKSEDKHAFINQAISDWRTLFKRAQLTINYLICSNNDSYEVLKHYIDKQNLHLICGCPTDCDAYVKLNNMTEEELQPLRIANVDTHIKVSPFIETTYDGRPVKVLMCYSPNRSECAYEFYTALANEEKRIYIRTIKQLQIKGKRHHIELEDAITQLKSQLTFCKLQNVEFEECKGYQQVIRGRPRKSASKSVIGVKLSKSTKIVINDELIKTLSLSHDKEIIMTTDVERDWSPVELIELFGRYALVEGNKHSLQCSAETRCFREKRIERLFARIFLNLCSELISEFLNNEVDIAMREGRKNKTGLFTYLKNS